MTRPRDSQRLKVYKSEWAVRSTARRFDSTAAAQAFVDGVTGTAWFQARWGQRSIEVRGCSGGGATGNPRTGRINVGTPSRNDQVLLHEIAHIVQPRGTAWHGAEFCATLLALWAHDISATSAAELRAQYVARRVKHKVRAVPQPKPTRVRTKKAEVDARRAAAFKPVGSYDRREAAAVIRRLVKQGTFGPSGCKPRTHALATARALEKS